MTKKETIANIAQIQNYKVVAATDRIWEYGTDTIVITKEGVGVHKYHNILRCLPIETIFWLEPTISKTETIPSPSGANVLVESLEKIKVIAKGGSIGLPAMLKDFQRIVTICTESLAQYNAVEPEKTQSHLERMCIRAQELFTEKKNNPKNKKGELQAAWNNLSIVLHDANQFLNKTVVKTPI